MNSNDRSHRRTVAVGDPLAGKRILLGVSGSIAAYKALALASQLTRSGATVSVALSRAATELVRPLAFRAITHGAVASDLFDPAGDLGMDHLAMAHEADCLLIAPATADMLAKLSHGLADDVVTTTALALDCPLVLVPAMEPRMWSHPATVENADRLLNRGARFIGPVNGRLASGATGLGRMAEPEDVVDGLRRVLSEGGPLTGRSIVVTAGPTRESIDPLRFVSNRSSGRMGFAMARVARDSGARVTLIAGPVSPDLHASGGVERIDVETADQMCRMVLTLAPDADALIMCAAVADFAPTEVAPSKLKKAVLGDVPRIELTRTPDILQALGGRLEGAPRRPVLVGFAAETEDLERNAREKAARKGLDLIVANIVPTAFGDADIEVLMIDHARSETVGPASKDAIAVRVLDWVRGAIEVRDL